LVGKDYNHHYRVDRRERTCLLVPQDKKFSRALVWMPPGQQHIRPQSNWLRNNGDLTVCGVRPGLSHKRVEDLWGPQDPNEFNVCRTYFPRLEAGGDGTISSVSGSTLSLPG
jgi:hypothetical protein